MTWLSSRSSLSFRREALSIPRMSICPSGFSTRCKIRHSTVLSPTYCFSILLNRVVGDDFSPGTQTFTLFALWSCASSIAWKPRPSKGSAEQGGCVHWLLLFLEWFHLCGCPTYFGWAALSLPVHLSACIAEGSLSIKPRRETATSTRPMAVKCAGTSVCFFAGCVL